MNWCTVWLKITDYEDWIYQISKIWQRTVSKFDKRLNRKKNLIKRRVYIFFKWSSWPKVYKTNNDVTKFVQIYHSARWLNGLKLTCALWRDRSLYSISYDIISTFHYQYGSYSEWASSKQNYQSATNVLFLTSRSILYWTSKRAEQRKVFWLPLTLQFSKMVMKIIITKSNTNLHPNLH